MRCHRVRELRDCVHEWRGGVRDLRASTRELSGRGPCTVIAFAREEAAFARSVAAFASLVVALAGSVAAFDSSVTAFASPMSTRDVFGILTSVCEVTMLFVC